MKILSLMAKYKQEIIVIGGAIFGAALLRSIVGGKSREELDDIVLEQAEYRVTEVNEQTE